MPTTPQDHKPKQDGTSTVTVDGITLTIPHDRVSDWDIVEGVATMQDEQTSTPDKLVAAVRTMKRLFDTDYERVKTELREAHGGKLTESVMAGFLTAVFKELNPSA